jgi:heme A synthase
VTRQPRPRHDLTARWPWYLLRTVITALAADIFLQSVFAGRFLSGDYPQLLAHRANAVVVAAIAVVLVIASLPAWRVAGAPAGLVWASAGFLVLILVQLRLGFSRNLDLHVPLGVLLIVAAGGLTTWCWRYPLASRPPRRPR